MRGDEFAFYLNDLAPRALIVPTGEGAAARAAIPEGTLVIDAEFADGEVRLTRDGRVLEPRNGFEPLTRSLRMSCSTTELKRQVGECLRRDPSSR